MSDDLSQDIIPVKDAPDVYRKNVAHDSKDERRFVFKLPREELEDRFLRVCEDNMVLKTHSRKQEDKIKKMATKLIRLINDHKKQEQGGTQQGRRRDLETEELIEEMQEKIRDLDRQNTLLKEKLVAAKQQLAQHSKRISPCGFRYNQPKSTSKSVTKPDSDDESRDNESRDYFREMRLEISNLKSQLTSADAEIECLTGLLSEREADYEKQILQLKAQAKETQKHHVDENVELIKWQREMKIAHEKNSSLLEQYTKLQENARLLKISHDQLVKELDNVSGQLKDEQSKTLKLRSDLQMSAANQHIINELKAQCTGLEKENEILKESNLKLIHSSFNLDREKYNRKNEMVLKKTISEMEEVIEGDLKEKEKISEELLRKKSENESLKEALMEAESVAIRFKEMYEEIKEKSEFLTQNNVSEALSVLKEQRVEINSDKKENFNEEQEKELKLLRADHAETVNELAKLRAILQLQYQINSDYKQEMEIVNQKLYQTEQELKQRSQEHKQLLNSQISKNEILEKQLADVARGTVQVPPTSMLQISQFSENQDEPQVEICFKKLLFTQDGTLKMDGDKASMLTWSFFDFELTASKIVHGVDPNFNCTVAYSVTVDETFVEYLHSESIRVELHQVVGTEYKTLAHGFIRLKTLIDKNEERTHGNTPLMDSEDPNTVLGNVEFWILINVPVSLALSHYRDRSKALGYVNANSQSSQQETKSDEFAPILRHINEISIKIIQCKGLKSDHRDVEPTSYIVYRFYDWPDHDSILIPFSESPYFNDHKVYRLIIDEGLHNYLLHSSLLIYAFDDSDTRPDIYLGVASVPLFSLTENKTIHGSFEFKKIDGSLNGTVDLTIKWLRPYIMPVDDLSNLASKPNSIPTPIPRKSRSITSTPVKEVNQLIAQKPPIAPRKSQEQIADKTKLDELGQNIEQQPDKIVHSQSEPEYLSDVDNDGDDGVDGDDDDDDDDDDIEVEEKMSSSDEADENKNEFDAESDDDVVTLSKSHESIAEGKITIEIFNLILYDGSWIISDPEIQMLYVEFRFLDFLPEETETPVALPKPKPNEPIIFNFHKEFKIEGHGTGMRRKMLKNLLMSEDPNDHILTFTVVSEPEEDVSDCQDIAYAFINLKTIFYKNKDLIEEFVPLCGADDKKTEVGKLKISVHILEAMKTITEEFDEFSS